MWRDRDEVVNSRRKTKKQKMFNKNQFLLKSVFLCALAGMLVLYGCQPKAADIYTNYSDKTKAVNKVFLLHDALIFNDVSGEEHVVHVPKNLQSLHWINKSVSDIVHEKGYQVAGIKALTVGLQVGMGESYLVYLDASVENPDWGSADDLNKERTPLAVELQEIDEARLDDIASLHEDIGNTHYTNAKGLKFEQVRSFGLPEDSVLLVTQSFGVQVHLGKKMAQGIGSAILSLGGTAD